MSRAIALLLRRGAFLAILVVVGACQTLGKPSPSLSEGTVSFDVTGTWQRCHQMGACKYTIEIKRQGDSATAELVRLNAPGDEGQLIVEDPFPATLAPGPHEVVVLSTMYGDTIEPNGEQTSLGEEARCETAFEVAAAETGVHIVVALVPGTCTLTVSMDSAS